MNFFSFAKHKISHLEVDYMGNKTISGHMEKQITMKVNGVHHLLGH